MATPTIPIKKLNLLLDFICRFLSSKQKKIPIERSKLRICIIGSELITNNLNAFQIRNR